MAELRPRIVVAGESLIDRVMRPDGSVEEHPGGGPFNTARALARLGCRVSFLGGLSTDANGRVLRATLEADGVDLTLARTSDRPTLIATATLDPDGVATYSFEPLDSAAASVTAAMLPHDTIALHVGTLGLMLEPTATTIANLVAAVPAGVLVMLDPNVRPSVIADAASYRDRLGVVLARADVVKASAEDLAWLEPGSPPVAAASRLVAAGASAVIVTDGSSRIEIVTRTRRASVVVPPRAVVDTIGAGDVFGAAFLATWVASGRSAADVADPSLLLPAVERGVAAAGWTVERAGADPPTPADLGWVVDPMR